jgi:chromosome partitioning protein
MLDVASLVKFLQIAEGTMESIEEKGGSRFDFIRILITRYSPNDSAQMQLAAFLRNTLGDSILSTEFLKSTAISDAGNTMNPILEVEPSSFTRKTYDRIIESVQGIALELEEEIMVSRGRIERDGEAS